MLSKELNSKMHEGTDISNGKPRECEFNKLIQSLSCVPMASHLGPLYHQVFKYMETESQNLFCKTVGWVI